MKWSNGKHAYRGKTNSRGQRLFSKIGVSQKGITKAFKILEYERRNEQLQIKRSEK